MAPLFFENDVLTASLILFLLSWLIFPSNKGSFMLD